MPNEYTVDSDLTGRHDGGSLSGDDIDDAILSAHGECPLVGLGEVWADVADDEDINELYMAAHAALETGWAKSSSIVRDKNNLYGFRAYDDSPTESAEGYDSFGDCIRYVMEYVSNEYLTPGGDYYNGATLSGMNEKYATAEHWDQGICDVMNTLADHVDNPQGGRSQQWPIYSAEVGTENEATYVVQHLLERHGYELDYHDGKYGPETAAGVEAFQADRGLTADGVAGPITWEALCVTVSPADGASNWATHAVNHALDRLLGYDVESDADYTDATRQAVAQFQRGMNLTGDGVVGLETWKAIVNASDD
jgi:hypothetical protein